MSKPKRRLSTAAAIDDQVGARMRELRMLLGLTRYQVANKLGITSENLRKYETGLSSVTAGRLFEVARVLNVPVSFFFEDIESKTPGSIASIQNEQRLLETSRSFSEIKSEKYLAALSRLVKALAASR